MKIGLISTNCEIYSLGVNKLSSFLKSHNHETKVVYLLQSKPVILSYLSADYDKLDVKIMKEIGKELQDVQIIGISLMTRSLNTAIDITRYLKKLFPDKLIIWGGVHPTISPEESIRYADIICRLEGYYPLLELASRLESGRDYVDIKNLWFKNRNGIIRNETRPLVQNLDELPPQDFGYDNHYVTKGNELVKLNYSLLSKINGMTYNTIAGLGCPMNCTYCCNNAFTEIDSDNKKIRYNSVQYTISELVDVKNRFPFIKYIAFLDDFFLLRPPSFLREFIAQYKEKINLPFSCSTTMDLITDDIMEAFVNAKLRCLKIGVQSGSDRTNQYVFKRMQKSERIRGKIELFKKYKKDVVYRFDIILDNPWENFNDMKETLKLFASLKFPYFIVVYSLKLYPGTELYDRAQKENISIDLNGSYKQFDSILINYAILLNHFFKVPNFVIKRINEKNYKARIPKFIKTLFWLFYILKGGMLGISRGSMDNIPDTIARITYKIKN